LITWLQFRHWRQMRAKPNAKVIKRLDKLGVRQVRYELQKLQNVRDLTNQDEEIKLGNDVSAKRSEIDAWIRKKINGIGEKSGLRRSLHS